MSRQIKQNLELQINALQEAGCKKIFMEKASGAQRVTRQIKLPNLSHFILRICSLPFTCKFIYDVFVCKV